MRVISLFFVIITSLLNLSFRSYQQTGIDFVDISQEWEFGERIRFRGSIQSPAPVKEAVLFIQPSGADTRLIQFKLGSTGRINQTYDLTKNPLQAFSRIDYWYQVKLQSGIETTSQVFSFFYEDNRYDWQQLESERFAISWADGDLEFGQTLMNVAVDSLASAQSILPLDPPLPLRIYVYPSAAEMQTAVNLSALSWSAGHADPDNGVILLSIAPGPDARAEMERQLPHEIMHILEYQNLQDKYDHAPVWLLEGLASTAELYPNPEYQQVLENAVAEESLIPIIVLCDSFPRDLSGAVLAYAESTSFVRFLYQNYGSSGITGLLNQYRDGLRCEAGVQAAFGSSLIQVEGRWQTEILGQNALLAAWKQVRPYIFLALIILIPIGFTMMPGKRRR